MRQRFPGFGFALSASAALFGGGCGVASEMKVASADAAAAPAPPMPTEMPARDASATHESAPAPMSAPAGETPSRTPVDSARAPQQAGTPGGAALSPSREMLDIEANVTLQVPKVRPALRALHQLTARLGGVITEERVDTTSRDGAAQLTLRVPSAATQSVFDQLEQLGHLLEQNVTARDIGKEYFDANLRLSSLEVTLHRYEDVLTHATKVEEILHIEQELGRLRGEIEQVKGNLRWLSDRAARATVHVALREHAPEIAHSAEPEAKFFPTLRLPVLVDFGRETTETYVGGGFALRFSHAISLDLDLLERPDSDRRGVDALLATVGGQVYSDLLGGGERRYLNPYFGWRAGYARFDTDDQAIVGATLGVELYKSRWFGVDVEARNHLAFGGARGGHYVLTPALSARIAF
jgi:hypothetical protein